MKNDPNSPDAIYMIRTLRNNEAVLGYANTSEGYTKLSSELALGDYSHFYPIGTPKEKITVLS